MKKQKFLFTMMVAALAFSSCNDELENAGGTPIAAGDEIQFGAANLATFGEGYSDVLQSRTAYGDSKFEDGKWHYPLDWVYGDGISVYCPQAAGDMKFTDYTIEWADGKEGDVQTDGNLAYMMKVGENGLHWGNLNELHKFYAFYPTSDIKNDEAFAGGVVHATIPNVQEMTWEKTVVDGKVHWVGKPNMQYAFMRGYGEVTPKDATNNQVKLDFKPLTTAVEVTLEAADDLSNTAQISQLQVQAINKDRSQSQPVCGDFTYDIDNGETTVDNDVVANDYMISVRCWHDENGQQVPIELKAGDKLTFTVFLLPRTDDENPDRTLHNLQIRVPGWNSTAKVKTYEGVDIPVGTKSQIVLPKYEPSTTGANTWIGGLPQNVYISQLSIPGSVNAFSSFVNSRYTGEGQEIDQTQTLSVEQQFNIGVRAFEIATERHIVIWDDPNLGKADLVAGDEHSSDNFADAMIQIADLVAKNPSEFAIVMPYYSPTSLGFGEDIPNWIEGMRNYVNGLQKNDNEVPCVTASTGELIPVLPFSNTMTISQAKGSILLLTRVATSDMTNPIHTSVIHNWNAAKDRWENRGWNSWSGDGAYISNGKGNNWIYESETPAGLGNPTYHIQDWMRVCQKSDSYTYGWNKSQFWNESKDEKISDITSFMDECIQTLKSASSAQDVFINNLAGYYIVSGGYSADLKGNTGGKRGDIPPFARDMNNEAYTYILNLNYENRGPLGIMLINYAGASTAFGMQMHGDYIVKALIDNNYSFELIGSK